MPLLQGRNPLKPSVFLRQAPVFQQLVLVGLRPLANEPRRPFGQTPRNQATHLDVHGCLEATVDDMKMGRRMVVDLHHHQAKELRFPSNEVTLHRDAVARRALWPPSDHPLIVLILALSEFKYILMEAFLFEAVAKARAFAALPPDDNGTAASSDL